MSNSQNKSSAPSQHSRSISRFFTDTEDISDGDLAKQVNELKQQIKVLTLENEVLENTIMRLDPNLMHGVLQAIEYVNKLQSSSSLNVGSFIKSRSSNFGFELQSTSKMLTSPSRISTRRVESSARIGGTVIFGSGPRINVLERAELVSTEMETVIKLLEKARNKAAKQHALLRAQLEEISIREVDFEKASALFQQEVLIEGWDKIAQRIPAEIWIRFMTEWVKTSDTQIGKLRLRTSTLNTQYSKLKGQIREKAELSESLRPVDFEKLRIENSECQKVIDQKFQQLEELKKMTGDANLNLTIHKKAMWEQNSYLTNILDTIKSKEKQRMAILKERDAIKVQADSLANRFEEVKRVRLTYEVPDVMEYVVVKSTVTDLKHSIKVLENRLHIQEIALASLNRRLNTLFQSSITQ